MKKKNDVDNYTYFDHETVPTEYTKSKWLESIMRERKNRKRVEIDLESYLEKYKPYDLEKYGDKNLKCLRCGKVLDLRYIEEDLEVRCDCEDANLIASYTGDKEKPIRVTMVNPYMVSLVYKDGFELGEMVKCKLSCHSKQVYCKQRGIIKKLYLRDDLVIMQSCGTVNICKIPLDKLWHAGLRDYLVYEKVIENKKRKKNKQPPMKAIFPVQEQIDEFREKILDKRNERTKKARKAKKEKQEQTEKKQEQEKKQKEGKE